MNFVWCLGLIFSFEFFIQNGITITVIDPKLDFIETKRSDIESTNPKIQGLRIIVDTTKKRESSESKSDEKDKISREKKTIGVRTDITFEIDRERNDSQSASDEKLYEKDNDNEDDNASVPIFKGVTSSPKDRLNSESIDSKEHRKLDNENNNRWNYYHGIHKKDPGLIFHSTDDENFRRGIDSFPNFIPPAGLWTTESSFIPQHSSDIVRNNYNNRGFVRSRQPVITAARWKPCHCDETQSVPSTTNYKIYSTRQAYKIDPKLDAPFENI